MYNSSALVKLPTLSQWKAISFVPVVARHARLVAHGAVVGHDTDGPSRWYTLVISWGEPGYMTSRTIEPWTTR